MARSRFAHCSCNVADSCDVQCSSDRVGTVYCNMAIVSLIFFQFFLTERRSRSSNLPCGEVFDFHAVALLDDFRNPAPVTMAVVALVAEDANGSGFFYERGKLVELFSRLRGLEVFCVDFLQSLVFAGTRG